MCLPSPFTQSGAGPHIARPESGGWTRDSVGQITGQSSLLYTKITFALKYNTALWGCWISDLVIIAFGNTSSCIPFNPSSQLFINLNPLFITISDLFILFLSCHKNLSSLYSSHSESWQNFKTYLRSHHSLPNYCHPWSLPSNGKPTSLTIAHCSASFLHF